MSQDSRDDPPAPNVPGPDAPAPRAAASDAGGPEPAESRVAASEPAEPRTVEPRAAEPDLPRRRVALLAAVAPTVLAADVASKATAVALLEGREPVRLAGGLLYLVLYRNSGAAFSLATGMTWLLTLIAIGVVIAIARLAPRLRSAGWAVGLGLILGGAMGNLGDRLFRAPGPLRGHVVDFVSFLAPDGSVWPVFNVADSSIFVGGALLVLLAALGHEYDGRSREAAAAEAGG